MRPPGAAAVVGHEGEVMANDVSTLSVQKRDQSGKGPSHRLRAKGLIPAVCYGPYDKPLHVSVDPEAIKKAIATPHKFNTVIKLQVEGGDTRTVLFKDFETDPVDGQVLHADFLEVRMDKEVVVNVPVILTGKPEGVTAGGILQQVARTLPALCKPTDIPEKIEVDVSSLKIAESLHVKDVKLPAGVKLKVDAAGVAVVPIALGRDGARFQGLVRSLIRGMVIGVAEGYTKTLQLVGTGYRAEVKGQVLNLSLGFSHPIAFPLPPGVKCEIPADSKGTLLILTGLDKEVMGQTAAKIRSFRPPEPYGGKGVRYQGEKVREKAGKAAKAGGGK